MYTFQDFMKDMQGNQTKAVETAISEHKGSVMLADAFVADMYDRQHNLTIASFTKWLYTRDGDRVVDTSQTCTHIKSNFYNRLNTQRMTYSLGNGVTFETDGLKEKLGKDFDTNVRSAGYYALIHGVSFLFWNVDHTHVFKFTEFAPLWDEENGSLRAGVRYWQIDPKKPVIAVLYEEDGYTKLVGDSSGGSFTVTEPKRAYRQTIQKAPADAEPEIIAEENYSGLPIIPVWGSRLHQSTIVGLRELIDAYDLVMSGFADDIKECAEIYWIVNNAGGMNDNDLIRFRDRLKMHKIANIKNADTNAVTPYTQDIPTAARETFLKEIRSAIYECFGGLDVHSVEAGATNDHIDAAYQPMDENADDYEYQIISALQHMLEIQGIEDTPVFKRNRISNQKEQVDMLMEAAQYLDDETILNKLPFITPDEVDEILKRKEAEDSERLMSIDTQEDNAASDEDAESEDTGEVNAEK